MSLVVDLSSAKAALEAGQFEDALAEADRALTATQDDPNALALKAEALIRLDRYEPALAACDRLLGFTPDNVWAHRLRCVALGLLNRHDEAVAAAREVMRLEPTNGNGYYLLGKAMLQLGHEPQARAALEEAARLDPDVPLYRLTLARMLFESKPAIAEALLAKIVSDEPHRAGELNDLGVLLEKKGDEKGARLLYQRAIAADPQLLAAKNNLDRQTLVGSTSIHVAALVVFFALMAGVPFAIAVALYRYGHGVLAGIAFTLAAFLTVAATFAAMRNNRKRSAAQLRGPECSVR